MCGITGYYSLQKKFSENDLTQMTNALSHRGPDAAGYFFNQEKTVGLGHRRLSIIDLSEAANQPMLSHSEKYVMVFNGEVYNFREIKEQLKISTRTTSDTEIILEAFEKLGADFVNLLNGMFAIAIYDKAEKKLFRKSKLTVKVVSLIIFAINELYISINNDINLCFVHLFIILINSELFPLMT